MKIIPLAISSTLEEGQGTLTVGGYDGFIASSFDLTLILTNRKFHLLNLFEVAMSMKFKVSIPLNYWEVMMGLKDDVKTVLEINDILIDFINENSEKLEFNLWAKGNTLCSADDLHNALSKGSLWDFIGKNERLSIKTILIGDYTINYFE